ncbi:UNKNOWN [Stylonychia lemnae]|uniref:Uncharacterized protein n=1 Tax=Stylonychia lemnae TaxID=5949 RepID=A0A078A1B1_STYLE|nr:UNKNOWN [Stylonychia lemnae]|eukprot:CDW75875.1 UNKNOWN [Stylonychia lemnae]
MEEIIQQPLPVVTPEFLHKYEGTITVVVDSVDKIIARAQSAIYIQDIFEEADQYAADLMIVNNMSEILSKTQLFQHDFEDQITTEKSYLEEPNGPGLDVYATFHLKVIKQTILSIAIIYLQGTLLDLLNAKKNDRGEDILPKPLINNKIQEDDRMILNFRRKKEREDKLKEEEKLKQDALEQRMKDLDQKGNALDDKNLAKKQITYDSKGDVIFIKNVRADGLPNPLLNPPFKIKSQKKDRERETTRSEFMETHSSMKTNEDGTKKKPKIQPLLLASIEIPLIKNEITPMGSVFNETEPQDGIKITEGNKLKVGAMNLSKRENGQMTLDEYRQQKEQSIVQNEIEIQRMSQMQKRSTPTMKIIEQDQRLEEENENKIKQISMSNFNVPPLNLNNQSQMAQTFYMNNSKILDMSTQNFYQSQSQIQSGRISQDRVIRKKESIAELMIDLKRVQSNIDFELHEQSSYIDKFTDVLRQPKKVQFQPASTQQNYHFDSNLSSARNSSMKKYENSNSVRLLPLLSHRTGNQSTNNQETRDQVRKLMKKNNEIMNNNNWGENPGEITKPPRNIEKKPKAIELKKSNSQLLLTVRRKERNFIDSVKEKNHLPPPPLGKSLGHGISNLPSITSYQQQPIKFL